MLLTNLRDFEWYNEPEDVSFEERGMAVLTKNKTDFWQSKHHNFKKDDGHFFSRVEPEILLWMSNGFLNRKEDLTNAELWCG